MTFSDPKLAPVAAGSSPNALHVPPDAHFSCHSCGLCCRVFQRIVVDEVRADHIQKNVSILGESLGKTLVPADALVLDKNGELVLGRQEDGACVFLTCENKCAIHAVLGENWKPQTCRDFPFIFRQTPNGLYVGVSFACPSVRGNHGVSLSEQQTALAEQGSCAFRRDEISHSVAFDSRYWITWGSYVEIERALIDLLSQTAVPLPTRLTAMHVLLGMLRLWLERKEPHFVAVGNPRRVDEEEVLAFIEANRRTDFREPLRIAEPKRGNRIVRRTFLSLVLACAASMWKTGKPLEAAWGIARNYLGALLGIGNLEIPPLPGRYPRALLDQALDFAEAKSGTLIERYTAVSLWRKDLAADGGGIRRGFEHLLLRLGLLPVYTQALKLTHGATESDALSQSIGLVEIYFGHHSDLFGVIDTIPRLAPVMDSFFLRKNYPDIILGRVK